MTWLYLPARDPRIAEEEWRQAVGGKWHHGKSAHAIAHRWFGPRRFPDEIAAALATNERLSGMEPLVALVEHEVPLAGRGPASHNDLLVIGRQNSGELAIVAVEGKVSERFGNDNVEEWLGAGGQNRRTRIAHVCAELGLSVDETVNPIRFQLLHRTASAVIEARRFNAPDALMLVHSFSETDEWFDDYSLFSRTIGASEIARGRVVEAREVDGIRLSLGWISGALPA
jgi:hypothetical protein